MSMFLPRAPSRHCDGPPTTSEDVGLYVHYPYCAYKCPYCDFNVHVVAHDDARYARAVLAEISARAPAFAGSTSRAGFRSIYFGGGTPSLWDPSHIGTIISRVSSNYGLRPDAEITLEVNPETVDTARLDAFRAEGVNRFSIGVQSFVERELAFLGRKHTPDLAEAVVTGARQTGAHVSIDLIYALPEQRPLELERSVSRALALEPDHVSCYTLTIEPETPFARKSARGLLRPLDDDRQASLIEHLTEILERADYTRYEVSSYARAGREAVHNSIYWTGGPYLGVGAGAHSYLPAPKLASAVRRASLRNPAEYIRAAEGAIFPPSFEETLSESEVIGDRLMTGLRVLWGVDLAALDASAGLGGVLERVLDQDPEIGHLVEQDLIVREGSRIRPSKRGFLFGDTIARRMLAAASVLASHR